MRDLINKKFENISHKWIKYSLNSKESKFIIKKLSNEVKNKRLNVRAAKDLVYTFKQNKYVFIKYLNTRGKSNLICNCQIITKDNSKINISLPPTSILNSENINGTPKSLKLYKTGKIWVKPKDNFIDTIKSPPLEEEFTELGYKMYVGWQLEKRRKNLK